MANKSCLSILAKIFILCFVVIIIRLIEVQILEHSFYNKKSQEQRLRIIELAAQRGDIFDCHGNILATSLNSYSVYEHGKGWLGRKLSLAEAKALKDKQAGNISLLQEKKRIYPKGSLLAQIIGFVGIDNQGLSGLELAFDRYLKGKEGKVITEGDPRGRELYGAVRELQPGEDGMNLSLTIDENIQYVAEREIEAQIKKSAARSGLCIVMDAKSGEILALASKPDFNPNNFGQADKKAWHPLVLDPYEPGSTFKLITVAAGLEEGVITPDTKLQALDAITVGGKVIENSHQIKWSGSACSVSRMLEQSINTGAAQVGLKLGPEKFYKHLKNFGFGEKTGFGLWGESAGILRHWPRWYKPDVAMITFGQSISVTPLQLLAAVSAFANNGVMLEPILVKRIESPAGFFIKSFTQAKQKRAVSAKTAATMKEFMRNVVLYGSGKRAKVAGFTVGGKTGTAQKASPTGGYLKGHYIASFIGFAPVADPAVMALVIVDDPKGSIWGESVCGPVFASVVDYTLRYLNTAPDLL